MYTLDLIGTRFSTTSTCARSSDLRKQMGADGANNSVTPLLPACSAGLGVGGANPGGNVTSRRPEETPAVPCTRSPLRKPILGYQDIARPEGESQDITRRRLLRKPRFGVVCKPIIESVDAPKAREIF